MTAADRHRGPTNIVAIGTAGDEPPGYVWRNGKLTPWAEATVQIHTFAYAAPSAVFDGLKAYRTADGLAVFRLADHIDRFYRSMKIFRMRPQLHPAALKRGVAGVVQANGFADDCYIVTLAYWANEGLGRAFGVPEFDSDVDIWIMAWPFDSMLSADAMADCAVSSWTRVEDAACPPRVKAVANYQSMRLAYGEAQVNGYDSAILLTAARKVSEAPGACIFLVREGELVTPDITSDILESVTRAAIITLARDELGMSVRERSVDRTELYVADEVFLAGTGVEVMPVRSVDRIQVGAGAIGPRTADLKRLYEAAVRGGLPQYSHWLTPMPTVS